jgi:small-conductance mechanosensitive channel
MAQFNLSIINDTQGNLQVKDFEQVKNELVALIDDEFQTPSVVDNSNYMIAKDQRAKLNKVSKLLTEQKTDIRKKALEIVKTAETQIKELAGITSGRSDLFDDLIKDYEAELEEKRLKKANAIYVELSAINTNNIAFETILEQVGSKWVNATTTEKQIKDDIETFYKKVDSDIEMAKAAFPQYYQFVIDYYLTSFDMLEATKEAKQAWDLANKHIGDGVPFTETEIADNKKVINDEMFIMTFTINTNRNQVEQLQKFMEHKGIEVISAKKGE